MWSAYMYAILGLPRIQFHFFFQIFQTQKIPIEFGISVHLLLVIFLVEQNDMGDIVNGF